MTSIPGVASRSTSSGRCRSGPRAAPRGRLFVGPSASRPTTPRPTVRQFHGCYCVGDDTLWGVVRRQKSAANTLAALRSIRARRRDGAKVYVILDNLSAHKGNHPPVGRQQQRRAVLHPDLQPGPTPSKRTSGRCESSCSTTPTTPTTPCSPAGCTPTCAGARQRPRPRCSPRNAANAPETEPHEDAASPSRTSSMKPNHIQHARVCCTSYHRSSLLVSFASGRLPLRSLCNRSCARRYNHSVTSGSPSALAQRPPTLSPAPRRPRRGGQPAAPSASAGHPQSAGRRSTWPAAPCATSPAPDQTLVLGLVDGFVVLVHSTAAPFRNPSSPVGAQVRASVAPM